jgi:ABC-2 type transport system permease protein
MSSIVRTASFFTTWVAEFLRHPLLLFGLVLGPFLILIAFGQGVDYSEIKPDVILVRSEPAADDQDELVPETLHEHVNVVAETTDLQAAIESLRNGDADGVAVVPTNFGEPISEGNRIPIQIFTSDIDPVTVQFTESYLLGRVARLNQETLARAIEEAQVAVGDVQTEIAAAREFVDALRGTTDDVDTLRAQVDGLQDVLVPLSTAANAVSAASTSISFLLPGIGSPLQEIREFRDSVEELRDMVADLETRLDEAGTAGFPPSDAELDEIDAQLESIAMTAETLSGVPPEVLSAPFELQLENVSPYQPTFTGYFSPAVLVLLLQHLGISLAALSMTRLRLLGLMDMLRVAPVRTIEIVNGKYLSYALLLALAGGGGLATMRYLLDVPMFGSYLHLAGVLVALGMVSLGIGFLVAMLARSEQHATQAAMLVLLAAVFFSGLIVTLDRIAWPMRAVSLALPSTYAIRTAQDVMLRGVLRHPEDLLVLAAAAFVLYLLTIIALRRQLRPH